MSGLLRSAAALAVTPLLLTLGTALPTSTATAAPADDVCAGFTPGYRTIRVLDDLAVTHVAVRYLPPTSSSRGRMPLTEVQTTTARARVDGHRAPKVGPVLTRRVERRLDVDLVPVGTSTGDVPPRMRFAIRNDTQRNQAYVLYRGTTTYWSRVQGSSCTDGEVTWRRVGQWTSFEPMSRGVARCGDTGETPLERAALDGAC